MVSLQWRHNECNCNSVSNHRRLECVLNRLFRHRSKKTSKLRGTGLCEGNSPAQVNSPHKGPVTQKMFPFDDVIMICFGTHCAVLIREEHTSKTICLTTIYHRFDLLGSIKNIWGIHVFRTASNVTQWNENVVILMKFSSPAALKVVKMTTFSGASDEKFL